MTGQTEEQTAWISSIEIIEKTGISRATLNNYIKMDILPKPVVKKPKEARIRAKRVGYFPCAVLAVLEQVRLLKQDGYTMSLILEALKHSSRRITVTNAQKDELGQQDSMVEKRLNETDPLPSASVGGTGQDKPLLAPFCVLAADLQDAGRLSAELPDNEFFDLLNQLWVYAGEILGRYQGFCGRHVKQGMMLCYFLKQGETQYLNNALNCAMELREAMKKLTITWKTEKGWFNELCLNIGLSEGHEPIGFIRTPYGLEPATIGDAATQAIGISEFARDGAIWLTKSLINRMNPEERERIHYGIRHVDHRQEVFIKRSFARMADLSKQDQSAYRPFAGAETLVLTELIDKD